MNKLTCCVAVAMAGLGGAAVAEDYVPGTGWKPFSWLTQNLGGGFINKDPFTFSVPGNCSALLQVTDSEFGGERFEVFDNGTWMGFWTSPPSGKFGCDCIPNCPFTEDFDAAFGGSTWSSGSWPISNGSYSLQFRMQQWCNLIGQGTAAFRVVYQDCNCNGVNDSEELANGTSQDCNGNGIPDECDIAFLTSQDCNGNGVPDECDIASGASEDLNANSIPDDCECLADIDNDTFVTVTDLLVLLATWGPCPPVGDCFGDIDFDGTVAVPDLLALLAAWGACP